MSRYRLVVLLLLCLSTPALVGAEDAPAPVMVPQLGQSEAIYGMRYAPDGSRVVTVALDGRAVVWNLLTGLIENRILAKQGDIIPSITPDNHYLLLAAPGPDNTELWSLTTGLRVRNYAGAQTHQSYKFLLHHDSRHVWIASRSALEAMNVYGPEIYINHWYAGPGAEEHTTTLELREIATDSVVRTLDGLRGVLMAISPDDTRAVTAVVTGIFGEIPTEQKAHSLYYARGTTTLLLWDLETGKEVRQIGRLPGALLPDWYGMGASTGFNAGFSPDGRLLAVQPLQDISNPLTLTVWDVNTGLLRRICPAPMSMPTMSGLPIDVAISGDATTLSVTYDLPLLRRWKLAGEDPPQLFPVSGIDFTAAFRPDGQVLARQLYGWEPLRCFRAADGRLLEEKLPGLLIPPLHALLVDGAGTRLVTVHNSGHLPVWDLVQGRLARLLTLPAGTVATAATLSPDGRLLLVGAAPRAVIGHPAKGLWPTDRGLLVAFDVTTGGLLSSRPAHGGQLIRAITFTPDGRQAYSAGDDGQLVCWDIATGTPLSQTSLAPMLSPQSLTINPAGTRIAVAGLAEPNWTKYRSFLTVFDLTQHPPASCYPPIAESGQPYGQLVFSPDGQALAELRVLYPFQDTSALKLRVRRVLDGGELWSQESWDLGGRQVERCLPHVTFLDRGATLAVAAWGLSWWDAVSGKLLRHDDTDMTRFLAGAIVCGPTDHWRLITAGADGQVTLWTLTGEHGVPTITPLATLLCGDDGRWLATTPGGYYDCALEAANAMVWRMPDGQVLPFDSFSATYQRPDILRKALAGADISTVPPINAAQPPPTVTFLSPAYGTQFAPFTNPRVEFRVKGTAPIARIELTVNGQPLPPALADRLVITTPIKLEDVLSLDVPLPPGAPRVRIRAVAYDTRGLKSAPVELALFRPGAQAQPGNLYVLAVGINEYPHLPATAQLNYAAPDATAFAKVMSIQAGKRPYAGVIVALQTDAKASLALLKLTLRQVKDLATENDTVLIYISGHGLQDADGNYYFPTYDADLKNLPGTALSWQDFQAALREMRAKNLLVLADTCQSAGLLGAQQTSTDLLADKLNRLAHRMVFTASQGDESSFEKPEWAHGAFTLALLEALGGKADDNKDGFISYRELAAFVRARVTELTRGRQHPQLPFLDQFDPDAILARVVKTGEK